MIENTMEQAEWSVQRAGNIKEELRQEWLESLGALKAELIRLASTHPGQAQSIAGFARVVAHQATRAKPNRDLLKQALEELKASVEEFEASHPRLFQTVNIISTMLANMGI